MADPAPVPAVTRGDVAAALYRSHVAADLGLRTESCNRLADAVLALLTEAPQPKVLAEVPTLPQLVVKSGDKSMVLAVDLDVPPGTPVAVVALGPPVPQTPEGEADEGSCTCGIQLDGTGWFTDGPDPQCPKHAPEPDGTWPR